MGSSVVTNVSLWCGILIKEKAMHVGGREDGKSLAGHLILDLAAFPNSVIFFLKIFCLLPSGFETFSD